MTNPATVNAMPSGDERLNFLNTSLPPSADYWIEMSQSPLFYA